MFTAPLHTADALLQLFDDDDNPCVWREIKQSAHNIDDWTSGGTRLRPHRPELLPGHLYPY